MAVKPPHNEPQPPVLSIVAQVDPIPWDTPPCLAQQSGPISAHSFSRQVQQHAWVASQDVSFPSKTPPVRSHSVRFDSSYQDGGRCSAHVPAARAGLVAERRKQVVSPVPVRIDARDYTDAALEALADGIG